MLYRKKGIPKSLRCLFVVMAGKKSNLHEPRWIGDPISDPVGSIRGDTRDRYAYVKQSTKNYYKYLRISLANQAYGEKISK